MQAKDVMTKDVVTAKGSTTIEEIASLMIKNKISGIPIVDDQNRLVGIVTEYDLLYKKKLPMSVSSTYSYGTYAANQLAEERRKVEARIASELMTEEVVCVEQETLLVDIAHLMIDKGIKRVPVTRAGRLVGVVSKVDVFKTLLAGINRGDQNAG